jgi:hypothetical protein
MVAAREVNDVAIGMLRNGYPTNKVVTLDGGLLPRRPGDLLCWRRPVSDNVAQRPALSPR